MIRNVLIFLTIFIYALAAQNSTSLPNSFSFSIGKKVTTSQPYYGMEQKYNNENPLINTKSFSRGKAILLSFIFPGAGEYYLGFKKQATFFGGIEIVLWGSYFWGNFRKNNVIKDYKNLAYQYAGVNPNGEYNEDFWIAIGTYDNIYENNEGELVKRNLNGVFDEDLYYWDWQSFQYQKRYLDLRSRANSLKNFTRTIGLTFFVNRILSVLNVLRLTNKSSTNAKTVYWNIHYDNISSRNKIMFNLMKTF